MLHLSEVDPVLAAGQVESVARNTQDTGQGRNEHRTHNEQDKTQDKQARHKRE